MCTRVRVCGAKAKRNVEGPVREAPGGKDTDCQCGWNRESRRNLQGLTLASSSEF